MRVVLIGAGRLATNLGKALCCAGHDIVAVYSRTMEAATMLANTIGGQPVNSIESLPFSADVFLIALKDSVLTDIIPLLTKGREEQLFAHTAGSMPLSLFADKCSRYGVFYPMQSFSKEREVNFSEIPVFLEANDAATLDVLKTLAQSVSSRVYELSTQNRKYLHLAAVFACNFANHCYALAADVLEAHGLPFDVMLPLIDETARKVHQLHPKDAQTGPAVRYDENVISRQRQLLAERPDIQRLYDLLSQSIHEKELEKRDVRCEM